mmetsp:Transcript_6399/g.17081  ORF Transcript_6399/g.17081 Transcript_6399/m.17081 type:complete len:118 (-) Transcript_6399:41-394(-)
MDWFPQLGRVNVGVGTKLLIGKSQSQLRQGACPPWTCIQSTPRPLQHLCQRLHPCVKSTGTKCNKQQAGGKGLRNANPQVGWRSTLSNNRHWPGKTSSSTVEFAPALLQLLLHHLYR